MKPFVTLDSEIMGARAGRTMFITFEGIEGSGKSMQIARAESYLLQNGIPCIITREPGGTEFGKAVRRILLDPAGAAREPESELLLYLADRYQHLKEIIEPALRRHITVLSDRYHDATRAYQGAARKISPATISDMARLLGIRDPDATILLDLEPTLGLERARNRNIAVPSAGDEGRFEAEDLSFHRDVRSAYLALARLEPERIRIVPAHGTPEDVFSRIVPLLQEWCQIDRRSDGS
jgi:dTMP kinase